MAKFATRPRGTVATTGEKTSTHEGGVGFVREPQAELYLTAVSTKLEPTFYESADVREARLAALSQRMGVEDPEWTLSFVTWLRREANMRSVAILVAAEAVKARLAAGASDEVPAGARTGYEGDPAPAAVVTSSGYNRRIVRAACLRADEPGEFIAYWQTRHGRNLPMPVKRGLADAARAIYNQRSALRYDGSKGAMRLGDVIELVHPDPTGPEQSALFGWLLDRRHGRRETPASEFAVLKQVAARTELNELPIAERHAFARQVLAGEPDAEFRWLQALAGQWEWGKSWLGQDAEDRTFERVTDADQWKLCIQHGMGYMAMLRNLRNFDEAGISDDVRKHVIAVLADPDEVKRSRQFPFRFWSAVKATGGGGPWSKALSAGLQHSLSNVPSLGGHSLILADMSGSMFPWGRVEPHKTYNYELAALFASALALRAERATLVQFGTSSSEVEVDRSKSVVEHMDRFHDMAGTQTVEAIRRWYQPDVHRRVVLITDEQLAADHLGGGLDSVVPESTHVHVWNLGGYRPASVESTPTRHTYAGLTDQSFRQIPLIETGATQDWPWED